MASAERDVTNPTVGRCGSRGRPRWRREIRSALRRDGLAAERHPSRAAVRSPEPLRRSARRAPTGLGSILDKGERILAEDGLRAWPESSNAFGRVRWMAQPNSPARHPSKWQYRSIRSTGSRGRGQAVRLRGPPSPRLHACMLSRRSDLSQVPSESACRGQTGVGPICRSIRHTINSRICARNRPVPPRAMGSATAARAHRLSVHATLADQRVQRLDLSGHAGRQVLCATVGDDYRVSSRRSGTWFARRGGAVMPGVAGRSRRRYHREPDESW